MNGNNLISIIIPNYNGKVLLEKNLPNIINTANDESINYEIIVVDDNSCDDSVLFIRNNFNKIKVIQNNINYGFSVSCNKGAKEANGNILFFLNNDMTIKRGFFMNMMKSLNCNNVFSVVPMILNTRNEYINESVSTGYVKGGFISFETLSSIKKEIKFDKKLEILWASGGAFMVNKSKFWELNGFDELYAPGYIEDVDLSYNALKKGWKIIYEPLAVVYHQKSSTMEKLYSKEKINIIYKQHKYIFIWKNITNKIWLAHHVLFILLKHITLNYGEIKIIWTTAMKLKDILKKRRETNKNRSLSDYEIFNKFKVFNDLLQVN